MLKLPARVILMCFRMIIHWRLKQIRRVYPRLIMCPLVGNVQGIPSESGSWFYPKSLNLGRIKPKQVHTFKLRCVFPVDCKLSSTIKGLSITPSVISTHSPVDVELRFDSFSPNMIISGWMLITTKLFTRKIKLNANIAATRGAKIKEGTGQLLYTPPIPEPPPKVDTPVISPAAGSFTTPVQMTLQCKDPNAAVYYTTDGTPPSEASLLYKKPITLDQPVTIKARSFCDKKQASDVSQVHYDIAIPLPVVESPIVTPAGGVFSEITDIVLQCATSHAEINYTLDGTAPTLSSSKYNSPLSLASNCCVKARAFCKGMTPSRIVEERFQIVIPLPVTPPNNETMSPKRAYKPGKSSRPTGGVWSSVEPHAEKSVLKKLSKK